jgi:hypothetical protein
MYDQQKLRGSVYDQGERNSNDFKKINKTHFKMRVGTNGLSNCNIATITIDETGDSDDLLLWKLQQFVLLLSPPRQQGLNWCTCCWDIAKASSGGPQFQA